MSFTAESSAPLGPCSAPSVSAREFVAGMEGALRGSSRRGTRFPGSESQETCPDPRTVGRTDVAGGDRGGCAARREAAPISPEDRRGVRSSEHLHHAPRDLDLAILQHKEMALCVNPSRIQQVLKPCRKCSGRRRGSQVKCFQFSIPLRLARMFHQQMTLRQDLLRAVAESGKNSAWTG